MPLAISMSLYPFKYIFTFTYKHLTFNKMNKSTNSIAKSFTFITLDDQEVIIKDCRDLGQATTKCRKKLKTSHFKVKV